MDLERILKRFEELDDPKAAAGMARFGIKAKMSYGLQMPVLKAMAKEIGKDHRLAMQLWAIDCRETRILASLIEDPKGLSEKQMEAWVRDLDSWEVCDQTVMNLFGPSRFARRMRRRCSSAGRRHPCTAVDASRCGCCGLCRFHEGTGPRARCSSAPWSY